MQPDISQYPDILSNISTYLEPSQTGRFAQVSTLHRSVLSEDSIFQIAMDRGYPYYKGMTTMKDLSVYENTPTKDLLYQAALTDDERIVHYWIDHVIGQDIIDMDDVKIIAKALEGAGLGKHVDLFKFLYGLVDYTKEQYKRYFEGIVESSAKGGNLVILKLLLDTTSNPVVTSWLIIESGSVDNYDQIVNMLLSEGYDQYDHILTNSAKRGYSDIVEDMIRRGANPAFGLGGALETNQIDIINRLLELNIFIDDDLIISAGIGGNIDIIHKLENRDHIFSYDSLMHGAVQGNHIDILDYAIDNGANDFDNAMVSCNDIEMMRKLIPLATDPDIDDIIRNVIYNNNYELVRLLLDTYGVRDETDVIEYAIIEERTNITKLIISKITIRVDRLMVFTAAEYGNFDILVLLIRLLTGPASKIDYIKDSITICNNNRYFRLVDRLRSYYDI